jgi:hypothetical protein
MLTVDHVECSKQTLNTECHYAKCRYAECRGAQKRVFTVFLINVNFLAKLIDAIQREFLSWMHLAWFTSVPRLWMEMQQTW